MRFRKTLSADDTAFLLSVLAVTFLLLAVSCDGVTSGVATPTPGSGTPTPSPEPTDDDATPTPAPDLTDQPTPTPTPTPAPSLSCAVDADCDDGKFCNGMETCNTSVQTCAAGMSPCEEATEECDEELDDCITIIDPGCQSDVDCDAGKFCNASTGQCQPDFTITCIPGAGVCNIANSSPGCENPECCEAVCARDASCCLAQWTQTCAEMAFSFSTCLAP